MAEKCSSCGRTDLATEVFKCTWPDGRITLERHCLACERTWQRQLKALGATIEPMSDAPRPDILPAKEE